MIKISLFQQEAEEPTIKITDKDGETLNVDILKAEKTLHGYTIEVEGLQLKRGRKKKPKEDAKDESDK